MDYLEERFFTDGHTWAIEHIDTPTQGGGNPVCLGFKAWHTFGIVEVTPQDREKDIKAKAKARRLGKRTKAEGREYPLTQRDWAPEPVGPWGHIVIDKTGDPILDEDTGKPVILGYGIFEESESELEPDRWETEWRAYQQDQSYYNSGYKQASKDAARERAHRFLQEQSLAIDAFLSHSQTTISKAYKAAWTRYRWIQLYSRQYHAKGFQWLTRDQWITVESIYAESLGLFGKEVNGRYGKRPAIAKQRLTDKDVRRWRKLAFKRYEGR